MSSRARRRILVTGGAGFIGRRVTVQLAEAGYEPYIYDSMQLGSTREFQPLRGNVRIVRGDIADFSDLNKAVRKADQILHLCAPSSFLMYEERPVESAVTTYVGFLNLMEAMRRNSKNRLVFASTSAVYEGLPTPWKEDMTCSPPDLKALSKLQNEQIAKQYADRYGVKSVALRPMSVYGVGEYTKKGYANVISLFVWAMLNGERPIVWGDGTQRRDFIYVDDCADLVLRALEFNWSEQNSNFEVFNVGTGKSTSFNDITRLVNERLNANLKPIYVAIPIALYATEVLGDMSKANRMLGWGARVDIQEGISKVVENARRDPRVRELSEAQKYALRAKKKWMG